jgi:septal ring factor EnvC (AmiA/AmiB activator)
MKTTVGGPSMTKSAEKMIVVEELLSSIQDKKRGREIGAVNKPEPASRKLALGMIVLVLLLATLGMMVVALKSEITSLKTEITDLRKTQAKFAAKDTELKIASLESKLEESYGDKEKLRGDIAQIRNHLEELKPVKVERKRFAMRTVSSGFLKE